MRSLIKVCWLFTLSTSLLEAKDLADPLNFNAAQEAYRQGDFAKTQQLYLEAIQNGHDDTSSLFYNLGTSFYKNGELGASMAAHLRALALAPGDPDVRYNLNFLLNKTQDKLAIEVSGQSWQKWSAANRFGQPFLFWSASICLALGLTLLGGYGWSRNYSSLYLATGLIFSLASLYPTLSLIELRWLRPDWGAVTAKELAVLASPTLKNGVVVFRLHEGAPFALVEKSGDWFKIKLSDAKTGWVTQDQIALFGKNHFSYKNPAVVETLPTETL